MSEFEIQTIMYWIKRKIFEKYTYIKCTYLKYTYICRNIWGIKL